MLKDAKNADLYVEFFEYIEDADARNTFCLLVGTASILQNLNCYPTYKTIIRDFRFYDDSGKQPFAFIINRCWLLFYFRPPAIRSGKFNWADLAKGFDDVNENPSGEWTVRIRTPDQAVKITEFALDAW